MTTHAHRRATLYRAMRPVALLLTLALAACGGGRTYYSAAGRGGYTPPGPPGDPWGPYITEAAARFAVPQRWIREVMHQESGGHQYLGGSLTTSSAGAMGLMQVIPSTYAMLQQRYGLGPDPYDPHDNILAGTAYIREMYERYGSPGFLAAYNAGPQRLESYLAGGSSLPNETVNYLASIAPRLGTEVAMTGPLSVYAGASQMAAANPPPTYTGAPAAPYVTVPVAPVQTAAMQAPVGWQPDAAPVDAPVRAEFIADPAPDAARAPAPVYQALAPYTPPAAVPPTYAAYTPASMPFQRTADSQPRFRLVGVAAPGGPAGLWAVQVGAFSDAGQARRAAEQARAASRDLAAAEVQVGQTTRADGAMLYRARLSGLSGDGAANACARLSQAGINCLTVPPA